MQLIKAMPPAAARPYRKAVGKDQKIDKAAIMSEVATPNDRIDSTGKPSAITRKNRSAPPAAALPTICQRIQRLPAHVGAG